MTPRELELWFDGWAERRRQDVQIAAGFVANLINVHVPKGKTPVRPEALVPRWARPKPAEDADALEDVTVGPADLEAAKARVRRRQREAQDREFWESERAGPLRAVLGLVEGPDGGGDP